MTVQDAVSLPGIDLLDAELIVAHALRRNRTWVVAHPEEGIAWKAEKRIRSMVRRRSNGEPLAYILGTKEFCGRTFRVTEDTLIPRPATEKLVDFAVSVVKTGTKTLLLRELDSGIVGAALIWKSTKCCAIADIGTGSGCIAVTLKKIFPLKTVIATDISGKALRVAKSNARALGTSITFYRGDALSPLQTLRTPFLIVSNPPYIPCDTKLMRDVALYEPKRALYAGRNGTMIIKRILRQAREHPHCVGIIMECRSDQVGCMQYAIYD